MLNVNTVAPKEVYDFLLVLWPAYHHERNRERVALIVCTLADPDCMRWLSENLEHGNQERLTYLKQEYGWIEGDDLPEWIELIENRLLLIKELLERIFNDNLHY